MPGHVYESFLRIPLENKLPKTKMSQEKLWQKEVKGVSGVLKSRGPSTEVQSLETESLN